MNEETIMLALRELSTDMKWVKKSLENHLNHHQRYMYLAMGAVLSLIGAVIVAVIL